MIAHNITKETYFSPQVEKEYLGSSSFKAWDMSNKGTEVFGNYVQGGCEAREIAKRNGEWQDEDKEAFLIGHYVHSFSEGSEAFQKFCQDNASELYQKNGKPYAAIARADEMIDTLRRSELVTKMRSTGEKEVILVGEIGGQKFKICVDIPHFKQYAFTDLKTTTNISKVSFKDGQRVSFIDVYDYRLQFALYSEIIRQNLDREEGDWPHPYVIAVDKQKQPDHVVLYMGKDYIESKLEHIKERLPRIVAVRNGEVEPERCEKCEYCRSTKVISSPISITDFEESLGL